MRVISADSHVAVSHDQVTSHLASRWHEPYVTAQRAFADRMSRKGAGEASTAQMRQNPHAAFTRPGYRDGSERLKDMDADGVDVEVVYSEVSAFRYLGDMTEGVPEASRAFNDVLAEYAAVDPKRLIVSYQVQVKDIPA